MGELILIERSKNMYYQEKRIIVSIISGLLILTAYCMYAISKYMEIGESLLSDLQFWATAMLIAIGGGIVITIIIQIIFHIILAIANEVTREISQKGSCKNSEKPYDEIEIAEIEDEMDRLIALKAMRNSFTVVALGFVFALVSLYFKMPSAIMLNITFLSFILGMLFECFSQLYYYRKGVNNV